MNTIISSSQTGTLGARGGLLRLAVRLDAWVSGVFGVVLLVGASALYDLLGTPSMFLLAVGGVCVLYAGALWVLQSRPPVSAGAGLVVVATNAAWVAASVLLVLFGWLPLTQLGAALVLLQAVAVATLADLQLVALL